MGSLIQLRGGRKCTAGKWGSMGSVDTRSLSKGARKHSVGAERKGERAEGAGIRSRCQPLTPLEAMLLTKARWKATNSASTGTVIIDE
ncbi:hypothetical protein GCM10027072_09550 [Streptomyces bullii]